MLQREKKEFEGRHGEGERERERERERGKLRRALARRSCATQARDKPRLETNLAHHRRGPRRQPGSNRCGGGVTVSDLSIRFCNTVSYCTRGRRTMLKIGFGWGEHGGAADLGTISNRTCRGRILFTWVMPAVVSHRHVQLRPNQPTAAPNTHTHTHTHTRTHHLPSYLVAAEVDQSSLRPFTTSTPSSAACTV